MPKGKKPPYKLIRKGEVKSAEAARRDIPPQKWWLFSFSKGPDRDIDFWKGEAASSVGIEDGDAVFYEVMSPTMFKVILHT